MQLKKGSSDKTVSENIKEQYVVDIISSNSKPTEATYTKFNSIQALKEIWNSIPNKSIDLQKTLINRKEILGYIDYKNEELNKRYVLVSDINTKYTPVMNTYCLNNGSTCKCKISKRLWKNRALKENDIIYIHSMKPKLAKRKIGEEIDKNGKVKLLFEDIPDSKEWWIEDYSVIEDMVGVLDGE